LLGPMLVALAVGTASTGACGGIAEVAGDSGTGSSSGGSSSGINSSSGVVSSSSGVSSSGGGSGSSGVGSSGVGSSSGVFDASVDSTFSETGVADVTTSCTESIPVIALDGGMNTACESCLAANCGQEECSCIDDPNVWPIDDAGTVAPACDVYVNCVYPEAIQLLLTTDAGVVSDFTTGESDCASGGGFPSSSVSLGNSLIACLAASCTSECIP